jgi:hypothetical protein
MGAYFKGAAKVRSVNPPLHSREIDSAAQKRRPRVLPVLRKGGIKYRVKVQVRGWTGALGHGIKQSKEIFHFQSNITWALAGKTVVLHGLVPPEYLPTKVAETFLDGRTMRIVDLFSYFLSAYLYWYLSKGQILILQGSLSGTMNSPFPRKCV